MSLLVVVGAGGHGAVVAESAAESGTWSKIRFLDDVVRDAPLSGIPVIGPVSDLPKHVGPGVQVVVAVGGNRRRLELLQSAIEHGAEIATVVHPRAWISRSAEIAEGSVVFAGVVVNARTKVASGCILNTGATLDHDCSIGVGAHISPGANLAGGVSVGDRSWVGIGASVKEGIRIGNDVIVGAGAAVTSDVADGKTVVGVPAKELEA